MEEVITLEQIYSAVQALAEKSDDEEMKEDIKSISESLYYYDYQKDEDGDIVATKVNRLEELNNNIEKTTLSLNTMFAVVLFVMTSIILIKTFFTGW